jgi:nitroreductase
MKSNTMIHDLISNRRSTVLFSPKTLDSSIIKTLFEAARWSPSSLNQQPWRFIYAQEGDTFYLDLLSCLLPKNQEWAKNAPLLIATIAQKISDYKDRENVYAWHDTAMAYANLVVQATSMGLSAHPMGGFDRDKTIQLLNIPERFEPVTFAAIGYKSTQEGFPDDLLNRENQERKRKEVHEFVFHGRFMKNSNL